MNNKREEEKAKTWPVDLKNPENAEAIGDIVKKIKEEQEVIRGTIDKTEPKTAGKEQMKRIVEAVVKKEDIVPKITFSNHSFGSGLAAIKEINDRSILHGKTVLVTGGTGFLGKHVIETLKERGAKPVTSHRNAYDLTNYEHTRALVKTHNPDYVVHCAGYNGGIEFNRLYPADIFDKNVRMGLNINKVCHELGVKKLVSVMTSCAHPDGEDVLKEENFWNGEPNESIWSHGIAKRTLHAAAKAYRTQYNFNSVVACVTNLFGPGDTFNLTRTKVVGAVIRKVVEAVQEEKPEVEFWGTGAPKREFMYVADAAEALVQMLEKYDSDEVLNVGTGTDMSIKQLVDDVVKLEGYKGRVVWLKEKGDGQMRKLLDSDRMRELLDIKLTDWMWGLDATAEWYKEHKEEADNQ